MHKTEFIIKDEDARRLRLRILLLENENEDLHEQLAVADDRIDGLEQEGDEVRAELDNTRDDLQRQEQESRIQARELNIMKVCSDLSVRVLSANCLQTELNAMNGVSMDSTKALTEKLALARELGTLKPELEHLRSQAVYQQAVLSEKLALQRQVNTLEVELETEKRAIKRISEKSKNKDKELELQQKVEELQKELSREKREKDKARKATEKGLTSSKLSNRSTENGGCDNEGHIELQQKLEAVQKVLDDERRQKEKARGQLQKELDDSETRSTLLEGKVDHIRTKLRVAKEELKECQAELEEARTGAARGPSTVRKAEPLGLGLSLSLAKSARKRPATEISTDVTIGTPDGTALRGKKRSRMDQTSRPGEKTSRPGEKSNFSITPYLNRTVSKLKLPLVHESNEDAAETTTGTATGSLDDSQQLEDESSGLLFDENSPSRYKSKPKAVTPEEQPAKKNALVEASPGMANRKRAPSGSRSISLLGMVTQEDSVENEEPDLATTNTSIGREVVTTSKVPVKGADEAGPKKKKRKLLSGGKTIFDEVEASATKRPAKISLGRPRSAGRGVVAGTKGVGIGSFGSIGGFGTFSPLKKDKKSFGGSVLA